MNLTNFARAALVAGAVTGASLGKAGNACATPVAHPAAPVSSIVAPSAFVPAPVTALGSWRGKKDDDGGGDSGGGDFGGGDDYSPAADDAGPDYGTGADYADVPDDPAPAEIAPDVADAPDEQPETANNDVPDTDSSPETAEVPEAPQAPEVPEAPEAPEAPAAPEAPEAPEGPQAPAAPEAPEGPQAPAAPEAPSAPETPETPDTPDSPPVNADPTTVTPQDIDATRSSIVSSFTSSAWSFQVSTWNSAWLSYGAYGQPILFNSYAAPMQVFYSYGGATRTVTIPPQQRVALPVTTPGQYGFTSLVRTPQGGVSHVSVGSFTGGGRNPAPATGASTAQPQRNAWVQLNYSTGTSQPFRVGSVTDLGEDSAVGGHRVLIDGSVSAWGEWSKNPDGSAQFEVSKTDQLPGLTAPSEAPLPGYDVSLVSKESSATSGAMKILPWVALAAGALGLGSAGGALMMGRRRRAAGSQ